MLLSDVGRFAGHFIVGVPCISAGGALAGNVFRRLAPTPRAGASASAATAAFLLFRLVKSEVPVEGADQCIGLWLGSGLLAAVCLRWYYLSKMRAGADHSAGKAERPDAG